MTLNTSIYQLANVSFNLVESIFTFTFIIHRIQRIQLRQRLPRISTQIHRQFQSYKHSQRSYPPPIRLIYTETTSVPPHTKQSSVFSICVDPSRLSEQAPSSCMYVAPFYFETSHQIPALPSTNPPNIKETLDGWGKIPGVYGACLVTTSAHGTSGWSSNNSLTFIIYLV